MERRADAASAIVGLNATMELGIIRGTGRKHHIGRRAYQFVFEGAAFDPFERKDT